LSNKKIKWLIYTVVIGLIPILARLLISFITEGKIDYINSSDIIIFGLILHISNINELEHYTKDTDWKTIQNGMSIVFIILYAILLVAVLFSEIEPNIIKNELINYISIPLSIVSFLISYSIYDRISIQGNKI
jgi:hypothetical protein